MQFFLDVLSFLAGNFHIRSAAFYVFLLPVLLVYFTLAKKFAFQWVVLLGVSLLFYFLNGGVSSLWIFVPVAVTYVSLCALGALGRRGAKRGVSALSAFVVVFNVIFLVAFKELSFFTGIFDFFAHRAGMGGIGEVHLPSPLGLSYISLMLISSFLDCAWGISTFPKNPLKFLAWVIFFPITTSGPIARYSQMESNLFAVHSFDFPSFLFGAQRILWGFMKKLVIADRLAVLVAVSYDTPGLTGLPVLFGLFLFAFQLYFDFSAYMDIVAGLGECVGIPLPENFMQPFFSESLSEIWRRWHATLGNWARDYILFPFLKSGRVQAFSARLKSRWGKKNFWARNVPTWCGMFIVWFSMGFWHGGSWNYICGSGLFFFALITLGQIFDHVLGGLSFACGVRDALGKYQWLSRVRTTLLFAASISFDRAPSLLAGFSLWARAFSSSGASFFRAFGGSSFCAGDFWVAAFFMLLVFFVERFEVLSGGSIESRQRSSAFRAALSRRNIAVRMAFFLALFVGVAVFGMYGPDFDAGGFIYGGF